ncbi:MAG: BREX-2 system phosphatase PglZ [Planctomycetaceae bacterium]|nr:MAG: BREX-2 system phosphatase PglZ [Planctomycetaceae bacterium]
MTDLNFNQIKAQVAAVRKKISDSTAIAIRSVHRWNGDPERREGDEVYRVHQCDSPLAMRVALRDQGKVQDGSSRSMTILITDLADGQIGDDILVRLKPRKVVPLDNWQIIKSLFQAREIDPRVTSHPWIATELMDYGVTGDCPPAASGFLDAETVWQIVLRQVIGLEVDSPDLLGLLKWSTSVENVRRWRSLAETTRAAMEAWIVGLAGPAAASILQAAFEHAKPDAVPIGLAAGVVLHRTAAGKLEKASGKFEERYLAGETPSPAVISAWHAAATDVVRLGVSDGRLRQQLIVRGDEILQEVGGHEYAWLSDTSAIGFDQRLARFGERLAAVLKESQRGAVDLEALADSRDLLRSHERAQRDRRRVDRGTMAMRLVRWLEQNRSSSSAASVAQPPTSLAEAARSHLREGGFVDWARLTLRTGDPVPELSRAYSKLFDEVTAMVESRSQAFAELLKDWTASGLRDDTLVPVEEILDRVVTPLAKQNPVLVVVIDGMSVAVFRELMEDVLGGDWVLLAEEEIGLRCGLAAVPSVTEVSRTSLLCGKLTRGSSANEQAGFAGHAGLVSASRSTHPPVIFHKASLQESEDASLAAEIRKEIGSPHRKVVGVVVNAVDDHLLKGDQIDTRWTRDEIKVLPSLLYEAKMSRRTLVLLSDHGHVLDCNAKGKQAEGGERWRVNDNDPAPGELSITGPRVVIPAAADGPSGPAVGSTGLIAAWSEKLRYGIKKNGYHGGLSPQEMVVPIAVLSTSDAFPTGWQEANVDLPAWWNESLVSNVDSDREVPVIKPQPKKPPETLFDLVDSAEDAVDAADKVQPVGTEPPVAWIEALLASPIFEVQKKLGGRAVPGDDVFRKLLGSLDDRGGKMTGLALASSIGCSPMRLRGLLAIANRVLNIDGYGVITRDETSDTVALDRTLLYKQFDLIEPEGNR